MKIPENQNIINSFVSKSEPTTYDHLAKWLIVGTVREKRGVMLYYSLQMMIRYT